MTAGRTTHSDRRRSLLVSGLGLVWTLIFGAFFFSQTVRTLPRQAWLLELPTLLGSNFTSADNAGWRYLPQRFDLLLCAIVILAAAWGLGRTLLLGLRTQLRFRSAEGAALTMGLGLSAWSLVTLGLGLAGWLDQWLFVACAAAFVVLGVFCDVRQRSHAEQRVARSSRGLKPPDSPAKAEETLPLRRLVLLSSFPFVLAMLLGSMLPSTDFDVKEYHLEGPKEYFLGGRVRMLPHNVYTSFPFLTEMLSLSAMVIRSDWWRGALAGKVVLMTYSMITSLGLFAIARRLAGETVGWLAVLIWLTTPWTYRISTIAYAEGGLTCYLVLTLLGLVMWRDRSLRVGGWGFTEEPDESPGEVSRPPTCPGSSGPWIFLTGLLAGSAAACKYPGVLSAVIPVGLTVLWIAGRSGKPSSFQWKRCLATGALYSAGVLVTFGPWLLKNLIETGNPVYPLLWSVLGGESFDAATNARWKAGHAPPTWLLQQPSQILPDLWQRLQDIFLRSDWQTPLLGALLPFSLLAWQRIRGLRWVWAYVLWLFFTWLWMTHRIDRFWVPMIPLLTLLAAAGLQRLAINVPGTGLPGYVCGALLAAVGCVWTSFNLGFITFGLAGFSGFLLDQAAAREIAQADVVTLCHHAGVQGGDKVLIVGEAAVFDADFPYVYNTVWDDSFFEMWCAEPVDGIPKSEWPLRPITAIRQSFADEGITHICVRWDEVLRYRAPGSYGFTDFVHPAQFEKLVKEGLLERTPYVHYPEWEYVDDANRQLIADWAPELRVQSGGKPAMRRIEIYRVKP